MSGIHLSFILLSVVTAQATESDSSGTSDVKVVEVHIQPVVVNLGEGKYFTTMCTIIVSFHKCTCTF
jgi:hypothetical protein